LSKPQISGSADPTNLERRVAELRQGLLQAQPVDPAALARKTGSSFEPLGPGIGQFALQLWGRETLLAYPEFLARDLSSGQPAHTANQALLLYYFTLADGAPLSGRWISFSELPHGRFYNQAFQGYTGAELGRAFQNDLQSFDRAATQCGGLRQLPGSEVPGDPAFAFQALPRLPLLVVCWPGDEDFPPAFQILFDAASSHYLPTDACAILGSTITRRLIAARS
jgi:hypothetical protein